ncbi:DUF2339 domain-containing protein [Undibacterium sp. Ji42W]|uniref:DUF2339 domain-containing protein n=1 Tax=Undibacterium sp. Ji42W TaxID=3413039 RepID=UPI003BF41380
MWFVGAIIGFILGVATGSGAAMFFFALTGGFVGYLIASSRKTNTDTKLVANKLVHQPAQSKPVDAMAEMRQKIFTLEHRLQTLEREMAELKAGGVIINNVAPQPEPVSQPVTEEKAVAEPQVALADAKSADTSARLAVPLTRAFGSQTEAAAGTQENAQPPALDLEIQPLEEAILVKEIPAVVTEQVTPMTAVQAAEPLAPVAATAATVIEVPRVIPAIVKPPVAKRPPPSPPKTLRESLPAPLAKLIFGGNALVKVGVLILFLGLAFLLRYTAERVTVPVELRYAGVALSGVILLALGWFLRSKRRDYALILQGMAIGVFYLTTLSAMKLHALISPDVGFGFLFLVSVLSAILAVLQNAPVLAIVAAIEGFATPVLISTGENRPLGLFTYMAVLDIGIFVVAWFNAWRVLNLIGFVGTFTLALGWAEQNYTDSQYGIVQPFLIFFFVLFALIGLLFARRTLKEAEVEEGPLATLKRVGRVDSALVFGNPITAFGMQYMLVKHTEFGAAFSALAVGFFYLLLARFVFSKARQGLALLAEAYVIVAAIFATLAIPLGLEGAWTGAAWAIEGAGMYWLGVRQQRPYARGFAYVVMVGAAYKLLHGIYINPEPTGPLLQGGLLGPVLLAISCFVVWNLHRKAKPENIASWEAMPNAALPWLGTASLALLPWMVLVPQFAAAAMAVMALLVSAIARRYVLKAFEHISATLQAAALASFMLTLHVAANGNAALEDGWKGGLAALIIAGSILFSAGRSMVAAKRAAQAQSLPPAWSIWNQVAIVSGSALLHLAMLFAINLTQASLIWPLTACLLLWVGLRMSHGALAGFSAALQVIAAGLCLVEPGKYQGTAFAHLGFLVPLSLAVSAWLSADLIRAEAARMRAVLLDLSEFSHAATSDEVNTSGQKWPSVWLNLWCNSKLALGMPVVWGLAWWLSAWFPESLEALVRTDQRNYSSTVAIVIGLVSSVLMAALAGWRQWPQMGFTTIVTLPLLIFAGLIGMVGADGSYLPSANLGWLAWPLALAWHLQILKKQQNWMATLPRLLGLTHIAGFWFFLLLAAREGQARLAPLADSWSSWPLLGWVLVPALVFWFIGAKPLAGRWPLNSYRKAYIEQACAPVALYLLAWCWLTNAFSAGDASPLPYLPLLNPLELGQWLVLASLLHWWRALPVAALKTDTKHAATALVAATALALLTGMVLRSCHHFAGVPWDADALFASRLSQAAVSITWAICGVSVMLFGNRRMSRSIWIAGAALLGVVVLKLFLIELADRGGLYRIVSFIGVGILLLVVGYFAPVPVKPKEMQVAAVSADDDTPEDQEKAS